MPTYDFWAFWIFGPLCFFVFTWFSLDYSDRITNGQGKYTEVDAEQAQPWIVQLGYKLRSCTEWCIDPYCAGTLISDRHVITTAKCTYKINIYVKPTTVVEAPIEPSDDR